MNPRRVVRTGLLAILLLASCAGMFWQESDTPGILIEGNRRPNMVYSCAEVSLAIADSKYCISAFVDHEGRRLEMYDDVIQVIDAYLPSVASLSRLAGPERWALQQQQGGFPFRFYILTISPIVVMVVPADKEQRRRMYLGCENRLKNGCLESKRQFPYRFRERPEVRPGSIWFSPDLKTGEQQIADGMQQVVIPLGASKLELTSDGKNWEVSRPAR